MTKDKAETPAIRARMAKTGERYTTARHYLLDHRLTSTPEPEAPSADAASPRTAEPGVSDAAVRRAPGKAWDEWCALLDDCGARRRGRTQRSRGGLVKEHAVDGWWARSVTVGHERAWGLQAVDRRPDGFAVGVSKTVRVPVEGLFAAFVDEPPRDVWLEPGTLRPRTARAPRSARFDVVGDGTRLEVTCAAQGAGKSSVAVQHTKLPTADRVETRRAYRKERWERLASIVAEPSVADGAST